MVYIKDFRQLFRDASITGNIEAKGYLGFFQDVVSEQLHDEGKGNDTLPEEYGAAWIFTKYRIENCIPIRYEDDLHIECWVEKMAGAKFIQSMEVFYKGGIVCRGRLESCIADVSNKKLLPIKHIDLNEGLKEDRRSDVTPFTRPKVDKREFEYSYVYKVGYSDLDKNIHMTNQRYMPMFMDAMDKSFYDGRYIKNLEIHFMNQCYYKEQVEVCKKENPDSAELIAVKEDGAIAAWCLMEMSE